MADLFYGFLGIFGMGHPMHPVIVHLVIGPIIAGFIFYIIGMIWKNNFFFKVTHVLNILSLVFWFFSVGVGVLDWIYFYGGSASMPEIAVKFTLAGILFVVLVFGIWLTGAKKVKEGSLPPLFVSLAAVMLCVGLGLAGGDIVYGGKKHDTTSSASSASGGIVEAIVLADGYKQVLVSGYDFQWKVNGPNLDVRLAYATTGWVGVGFGSSAMQGSSIFVGYVKNDGKVIISDEYGNAKSKHAPVSSLGSSDVATNKGGSLVAGTTTISFTIPLEAKDKVHVTLSPGDTVSVILAAAPNDAKDTLTYHGRGKYASIKIKL